MKIVKKALFFAMLISASLGAGGRLLPAEEQKGPRLEIKEEHYDAGKVAQGEQVVHVFEVRNAGDAILEIQKVQTS
jgi:hypothetical protein